VQEDNFFLPFTDAFDTNTIWVESEEDRGDFTPMNCNYGEIIQWDGSNLTHGNKINTTGKARVSIDFRVMKYSNYKPSEYGSINTKTKFQIGGYYKIL
jgi:ectoine hydroxylase-related dioxygenase (phytanoyl-CoA dioxygenase family)